MSSLALVPPLKSCPLTAGRVRVTAGLGASLTAGGGATEDDGAGVEVDAGANGAHRAKVLAPGGKSGGESETMRTW